MGHGRLLGPDRGRLAGVGLVGLGAGRPGPDLGAGNGFATRYAEDFALLADLGLTHHRLSIDWARIEPEEGRRDEAAVQHYRAVLTAARDAGIEPWVTLHHFVLPRWVADVADSSRTEPHRGLGPSRRLHGRHLRRPRVRLEAGQRVQHLPAARLPRSARSRRATRTRTSGRPRPRPSTSPPPRPVPACGRPASRCARSSTWPASSSSTTIRRADARPTGCTPRATTSGSTCSARAARGPRP